LFGGKTLWVVSTSALFLGVPYALAFSEEQAIVDMEAEAKAREQGTREVCINFAGFIQGSMRMTNHANIEIRFLTLILQQVGNWDN
jgi:hypothetical protein